MSNSLKQISHRDDEVIVNGGSWNKLLVNTEKKNWLNKVALSASHTADV